MAFTFRVKSSDLISAATAVSALGNTIGGNLQAAYAQIQSMSDIWVGNQYDKVAAAINQRKDNFNNVIRVLTNDLPRNMEQVAMKYAAADDEVCGSVTFSEIRTIEDVNPKSHEATEIQFDETQIQTYTEGFVTEVNTAIANIETLSSKIPSWWLGFADDVWKSQVGSIQSNVRGSANAVVSTINTQSNTARLALSGAEQSNIDLSDTITSFLDQLLFS